MMDSKQNNENTVYESQKNEENKQEMDQIKEEASKEYDENMTSEAKNNDDGNLMMTNTQIFESDNNLDMIESHFQNKFESAAEKDLLSEMKSELKALDAGYDTLTLIEQIEMFNSLNSSFLNKNSIFIIYFCLFFH